MGHAENLAAVRQLVRQHFAKWTGTSAVDWCETILVQDGFYYGRRFTLEGWQANWKTDESVVRFYDQAGELLGEHPLDAGDASEAA